MKTLSVKMRDVLFGQVNKLSGGTPIVATMSYPKLNGTSGYIYWEGNVGMIITMYKKIEKLEQELWELKTLTEMKELKHKK